MTYIQIFAIIAYMKSLFEDTPTPPEETTPHRRAKLVATIALATGLLIPTGCAESNETDSGDDRCFTEVVDNSILPASTYEDVHGDIDQSDETLPTPAHSFSIIHTVQEGETLSEISDCFFSQIDLGLKSIQTSNPFITDVEVISPGQELTINITSATTLNAEEPVSVTELSKYTGYPEDVLWAINRSDDDAEYLSGSIAIPKQRPIITDENSEVVIVQSGDTISQIAADAGVTMVDLIHLNEDAFPEDPNLIKPGNMILVPTKKPSKTNPGENPYESPEVKLKAFIDRFEPVATVVAAEYKIPKDAILAQAILESAYGTSELVTEANNYFGIKAGKDWDGDTYQKLTQEDISADELGKYPGATIVQELPNSKLKINVLQSFRSYKTPEDSFMDYGIKITTSEYYQDAVGIQDAKEYIKKLTDDNHPKYASDIEYYNKVSGIIDRLMLLDQIPPADPETPEPSEKSTVIETIESMQLSMEGFEQFLSTIDNDFMELASQKTHFQHNETIGYKPLEFVTLHFTDIYYNSIRDNNYYRMNGSFDPSFMIQSMDNSKRGVQFAVSRDAIPYQFTDKNTRVSHNPPYNRQSIGIEIEGTEKVGIAVNQYETAAYLALYILAIHGLLQEDTDLSTRVLGHAETRVEARKLDTTLKVRLDFQKKESVAIRKQMEELTKGKNGDKNITEIVKQSLKREAELDQ